jgi:integrase
VAVPFGRRTALALDRYLRTRASHAHADGVWPWLGTKGRMTNSGISQMLRRRATQAGIGHVHPHQFRHTFAHCWLAEGGTEGDLMRIAGWSSPEMLSRYGASCRHRTRPPGPPPSIIGRQGARPKRSCLAVVGALGCASGCWLA